MLGFFRGRLNRTYSALASSTYPEPEASPNSNGAYFPFSSFLFSGKEYAVIISERRGS